MLTVDTDLAADLAKPTCHPIVLVTINAYDGTTLRQKKYVTPDGGDTGYPQIVASITSIGTQIDPITRASSSGELSIELHDEGTSGEVRTLVSGLRVVGKAVTVQLFTVATAETDALTVWKGTVDDIEPSDYTSVTIRCVGSQQAVLDREVTGPWFYMHPIEVAVAALQAANVPSGEIDTGTTMEYTEDALLSHLVAKHRDSFQTGGDGWYVTKSTTCSAWYAELIVTDNAAINAGDSVSVWQDGTKVTLTEGVFSDWVKGATGADTAASIRDAVNAHASLTNITATVGGTGNLTVIMTRDATGGTEGTRSTMSYTESAGIAYWYTGLGGTVGNGFMAYFNDWKIGGVEREHGVTTDSTYRNSMYLGWYTGDDKWYLIDDEDGGGDHAAAILTTLGTTVTDAAPLAANTLTEIDGASATYPFGIKGSVVAYAGLRPFNYDSFTWLVFGCPQWPPETTVKDVLDAMALVLGGAFVFDASTGKWKYIAYHSSTTTDADWTSNDVAELEQVSTFDNAVNRVECTQSWKIYKRKPGKTHDWEIETEEHEYTYVKEDATAQAAFGLDGTAGNKRVLPLQLDLEWFSGCGSIDTAIATTGGTIGIKYHTGEPYGKHQRPYGCVGMAGPAVAGAQAAERQVDSDNLAYFLVDAEIIECNDSNMVALGDNVAVPDRAATAMTAFHDWCDVDYTASTRAYNSTTAAAHVVGSLAFDITPSVIVANRIVTRAAYGLPIIRCRTSLAQIAIDIGDLVSITHDAFIWYGYDGLTTAVKWEVIGKDIDLTGDFGITYTLARQ